MAEVESDLTHELRPGAERVVLTEKELSVVRNGEILYRVDLGRIKRAYVEDGIGLAKLVVELDDGSSVEAAYFTKRKLVQFRALAKAINLRRAEAALVEDQASGPVRRGSSRTLLWLFSHMAPYKYRLALGVALSLAITALNLVPPYMLKVLIDQVLLSPSRDEGLFVRLTLLLVAAYASVSLLSMAQNYVLNTVGQRVVNDLRGKLYSKVLRLSPSVVDKISTGRILSRLTTDAGNAQWLMVWGLPTLLVNTLTLIGIGVILFSMDPRLAVYVLVPVPLIVYLLVHYRRVSRLLYHRNWRRSADMTSAASDVVPNYAIVKAYSREGYETSRFWRILDRLYESQRDVAAMNSLHWPPIGFLTSLATVMIWWFGGNQVIAGNIELGVLTAFVSYMAQFYGPINNLSNIIPFIQQAITSGERLREIMEAEEEPQGGDKKPSLRGPIEFRGVWFGYEPLTPVLKNINLRIERGQKVALVGRSGSGKTSIAKLLLKMYQPAEGSIYINGVDIREIDTSYLRRRIAYVSQEVLLFDDTVANNVAYGADGKIGPYDILKACWLAKVHDDIMKMPLAYDTPLGERGSYLSGGQRQRISLARALVKDPDIFIFDEATSNLDALTEKEVFSTILGVVGDRTAIFITHSPVEALAADKVVVMRDGEIVEQGAPAELLIKGGEFSRMFSEYAEAAASMWSRRQETAPPPILKSPKVAPGSRRSYVKLDGVAGECRPTLPFPVSHRHFVLLDCGGRQYIIEDYTTLDEESRTALERAIGANVLVPRITSIKSVDIKGDELVWDVETEIGRRIVSTRGRRNVMVMDGSVVLIDVYENAYVIEVDKLDARSRYWLDKVV
ncbi:ABC transporter related protein [Thermoproteus uzoniensis 768-20]|uniref:ABC transporter related protein n=1 Tax=Thermoproteus uzoniensis (strain 768-20) TaxID=999630 RepID=F2L216_THEU7|nr:DUF1854 domain-containing protein [Thermoproteus uzoniensis]AEA11757.1 ABC transporter related protein [Thermoproteus uzoniensis 768-20]